jgi:hypothetical protein
VTPIDAFPQGRNAFPIIYRTCTPLATRIPVHVDSFADPKYYTTYKLANDILARKCNSIQKEKCSCSTRPGIDSCLVLLLSVPHDEDRVLGPRTNLTHYIHQLLFSVVIHWSVTGLKIFDTKRNDAKKSEQKYI